MASGYFGFTSGGTQYSTPAGTYQTVPTAAAYVPQTQAYTATAVAARPATYEAYQTASNTAYYATAGTPVVAAGQAVAAGRTYNYAYATPATVNTYDPKSYYPNSSYANTGNGLIATTPPSVWSDGSTAATTAAQKNSLAAYGYVAAGSQGPNQSVYGSPTSAAAALSAKNSYDAALYSAATSLYQQQSGATWPQQHQGRPRNAFPNAAKKKGPPSIRTQQLYYCETCKISCAGPQTYREHLEGQRHKKKAAAAATTTKDNKVPAPPTKAHNVLRCELCDVTCTGADAYQAHLRGTKHQKVVKLHQKLGKPIPPSEPTMIGAPGAGAPSVNKPIAPVANNGTPPKPKVLATPRINFIGAGVLKTLSGEDDPEDHPDANSTPAAYPLTASEIASITSAAAAAADASNGVVATEETIRNAFDALPDKEVSPVGHEYVEEIRNEVGKVISFHCKLCECKFNDPNAKEMHLKGRRHRLQYKKKVDPNMEVEIKANLRNRRSAFDEKMRRQKEALWRQREKDDRWREEMNARMMAQNSIMSPQSLFGGGRRPETSDDRHVMSKHATIYPTEDELQAVQEVVSAAEKSLKLVSDQLLMPKSESPLPEIELDEAAIAAAANKEPERILKGVQRVGALAKGLLLRGDREVELVVSCSMKPSVTLLGQVYAMLPDKLAEVASKKFDLEMTHDCIYIVRPEEPTVRVAVCLTSPLMREASTPEEQKEALDNDPTDLLDRHKCLQALAAVRHAKWFQAKASGLHSCVIVIRIFREMQTRNVIWSALSPWALELLVEKCIESGGPSMSPGDGFRRVLEAVASGLLYEEMSGLYDPCEKDPTDALISLTPQQREDITYDAQHCLRLIAFRQIYRVLNIDQLPAVSRYPSRKRRLSSDNTNGSASVDGKKDKKEDDGTPTEAFASANLTNTFVVAS